MTADSEDHEKETLLKFIYQTPLGLAQFSDDGNIELLNATGVALFYQFFPQSSHSNIYKLLEDYRLEHLLQEPKGNVLELFF